MPISRVTSPNPEYSSFISIVKVPAAVPFIYISFFPFNIIPAFGVVVYHIGGYLEYIFGIKDTARVFPVHGLW